MSDLIEDVCPACPSPFEPQLPDVEAVWADEIARRVAAYKRGEVAVFEAEDVFAEAKRNAP